MIRKILVLLSAVTALASCAGSNNSPPGADERVSGQERGGGDDTGLEFNQALRQSLIDLKGMALPAASAVDYAALDQKMSALSVIVVTEPLQTVKDGKTQESVALNDRSKTQILVNRARWHDLIGAGLREALALHEILSLAGYESTGQYPISTAFMMKLGLTHDPGYLDTAAVCVETVVCSIKDPICAFAPHEGGTYGKTFLDMYVKVSVTCTDHIGNVQTFERVGGKRYDTYANGADDGQAQCEGHRQEVAYMYPRCPGF